MASIPLSLRTWQFYHNFRRHTHLQEQPASQLGYGQNVGRDDGKGRFQFRVGNNLKLIGELLMRDIRDDLQERADSCHDQIRAIYSRFESMVQQLQSERDTKIADLKSALTMIEKVMQFENGYMGNVVPLENPDRMKVAS